MCNIGHHAMFDTRKINNTVYSRGHSTIAHDVQLCIAGVLSCGIMKRINVLNLG